MRRLIAAVVALALGAAPAAAETRMAGAKLTTAHDALAGIFFLDATATGADLTPGTVAADRFSATHWTVTNHTNTLIYFFVYGRWTPNYATPLDFSNPFTDYLVFDLEVGESITFEQRETPLEAVMLFTTISSGYMLVLGWK